MTNGLLIFRWINSILLMLFFVVGTVCNYGIIIRWYTKKKNESLIPLVSGLLGMIGLLIIPLEGTRAWFWVPLIIDVGCVPVVIYTVLIKMTGRLHNK